MFEYLMPSLVMRAPAGKSPGTNQPLIVRRQISYGAELGVPWGISESAYNGARPRAHLPVFELRVPGLG